MQYTEDSQALLERFEQLERKSRSYTWEIDLLGRFTYISSGITDLLGYNPEDLINLMSFADLLTAKYHKEFSQPDIGVKFKGSEPFEWEHQQVHLNGIAITFHTSVIPILDAKNQVTGYRGINLDITHHKNAELALFISQERLNTIISVSNIGAWEYDSESGDYWCTHEYFTMLGYDKDRFPNSGRFPGPFQDLLDSLMNIEDLAGAQERLSNYMNSESDQFYDSYFRMKKSDGNWAWIRSRGIRIRDAQGRLTHRLIGTHIDVTDLKDVEASITTLSYTDPLTNVYNRRYFEDQMQILDKEENLPLSLIMADVNGLKLINDAFGHIYGDELLIKAATILTDTFRRADTIARIGGDEFVIMMPRTTQEQAQRLVERIEARLETETLMGINVSIALGTATKENKHEALIDAYKAAEHIMYQVKINNREKNRLESIQVILNQLYQGFPKELAHGLQVATLCKQIGNQLNLEENQLEDLYEIATLHDIGKIALPKDLFDNTKVYNEQDWQDYYRHPEIGYHILSSSNHYAPFANDVLHHHEHWDGSGHPRSISRESIPLFARILGVADAYDALAQGLKHELETLSDEPLKVILAHSGTFFDPTIVAALVKVIENSQPMANIN